MNSAESDHNAASDVVYSNCQCVFVRFLFVFGFFLILHVFGIAWWPSAGKGLSSWLFACAVLLNESLLFVFLSRSVSGAGY